MASRSDLQRLYVERKKKEMGEEAYLEKERQRKSEYKSKDGTITKQDNQQAMDKLRKIFVMMDKTGGKPLSAMTIMNYVGKINKLSILTTGHAFDGTFEWLNNHEKVIDAIKNSGMKSKKDYISPISKLLKLQKAPEDIMKAYSKALLMFKKEEDDVRGDNTASQKLKDNYISIEDARKGIHEYKPKTPREILYKTILSFYFTKDGWVPRGGNLPDMKVSNDSKKNKDLNTNWNFLTLKDGVPKRLIIQRFKNVDKYLIANNGERPVFQIDDELKAQLEEYLKAFPTKIGDFLFITQGEGKPYTVSSFNKLLADASEAILGVTLGSNMIRSITVTDFYKQGMRSINESKALAKRMFNSISVGTQYMKLDADEE